MNRKTQKSTLAALLAASACMAALSSHAAPLATASFDSDSYVFASTNNLGDPFITVSAYSGAGHFNFGVVEFDVSGLSTTGDKYLTLEAVNYTDGSLGALPQPTGTATVHVGLMPTSWSNYLGQADKLSWFNTNILTMPSVGDFVFTNQQVRQLDVTGVVNDWILNNTTNNGFALWMTSGGLVDLTSSDAPGGTLPTLDSVPEPSWAALGIGLPVLALALRRLLRKRGSGPAGRSGFSLVELLVAIAIIALLGVLTSAAVSGVRENARTATELSSARQVMMAYLLYPQENGGKLLPAVPDPYTFDYASVTDSGGNSVGGLAVVKRYPFRLRPYLGDLAALFPGEARTLYSELTAGNRDSYQISLFPSFGLNADYVGGNYQSSYEHPERGIYGSDLSVTRLDQAVNPAELIVFVSTFYGEGDNLVTPTASSYLGFHRAQAPKGIRTQWAGSYSTDYPSNKGYVHFRHDGRALAAHLDGSVGLYSPDELEDMRKWSNQAAKANDPDFRPVAK